MPKLILPGGAVIESDNANDFLPFVGKKAEAINGEPTEKRRYTRSHLRHSRWSGQEIETVAQNLARPVRELMQMLPTRTSKAIIAVKGQLKNNRLTKAKEKTYTDFLNNKS